jgi:hypothetical protein
MHRVRDQQGRFISSSKNPRKTNSACQYQEGKEHNHPNYLSPTTSFLAKKKLEPSPHEYEIVQGAMHTEVPLFEGMVSEQYHFGEFIFPKVLIETTRKEK